MGNAAGSPGYLVPFLNTTTVAAPDLTGFDPGEVGSDPTPLLQGSAAAESIVSVHASGDCTGPVVATGTAEQLGGAGIEVDAAHNATTTFSATARNVAGWAVSGCSPTPATYEHDDVPPGAPSGMALDPAGPANTASVTVRGSAETGSTVTVHRSANCSGAGVTGAAAAFATSGLDVAVARNATTALTLTATDAAGNVSACTSPVSFVEDSTPPTAPTGLAPTVTSPANAATVTVTGTAEAGSTVALYRTADCSGASVTGTAAAFAAPGITTALPQDVTTHLAARTTDAAGNASPCSASVAFTEDSTPPAAPTGLATAVASPGNVGTISVTGTAEAGSTVALHRTADCSGASVTGTAADFATTGVTAAVAQDATTSFTARATDAAGNESACSTSISFVEDSTAPAAPTGLATTVASPANVGTVTVTGSAEAGSTVTLHRTADCSDIGVTGSAAAFAAPGLTTSVVQDATTHLAARATDAAGNASPCSTSISFVEDSTPPAAPTGLATDPAGPADAATITLTGAAEAGSTVLVHRTADCSGATTSTTAATFGVTGVTLAVVPDSINRFSAIARDAAGNASTCSAPASFEHVSVAPSAPAGLTLDPTGPANVATVTLKGTAPTGTTVLVHDGASCAGLPIASVDAVAFGLVGVQLPVAQDATTRFSAVARSAGGARSACTASPAFVEDSTAPDTLLVSGPSGTVAAGAQVVTFAASESDATFVCALDGQDVDGCSSPLAIPALATGEHSVTVAARDAVGNLDATPLMVTWTVAEPAPPAGGDPAGGDPVTPAPDPQPVPDTTKPALRVTYPAAAQLVFARGALPALPLTYGCPADERNCTVTSVASIVVKQGRRQVRVNVGTVRVAVAGGASKRVVLRLDARARTQLAAAKRLAVRLETTAVDAAGNRSTALRTTTLRLRRS